MSTVVGIDLSTFTVDLAKLDETLDRVEWLRIETEGGSLAWDRLLRLPDALPPSTYWDDVYLVAIEAPHGRGEAGTQAKLNHVVGALAATLPAALRTPERCWLVAPHEWKNGLGLKGKPTEDDVGRFGVFGNIPGRDQNGRDAYCIALWARNENAKGTAAA